MTRSQKKWFPKFSQNWSKVSKVEVDLEFNGVAARFCINIAKVVVNVIDHIWYMTRPNRSAVTRRGLVKFIKITVPSINKNQWDKTTLLIETLQKILIFSFSFESPQGWIFFKFVRRIIYSLSGLLSRHIITLHRTYYFEWSYNIEVIIQARLMNAILHWN